MRITHTSGSGVAFATAIALMASCLEVRLAVAEAKRQRKDAKRVLS